MPGIACTAGGCDHVTLEGNLDQMIQLIQAHNQASHPVAAAGVPPAAPPNRPDKPKKPVLEMSGTSVEEENWNYFLDRWRAYKIMAGIGAATANQHFRDSLPHEVGKMLYSTYGEAADNQTELVLIENVKKLAVRSRNKLASVVELVQLRQEAEQPVEAFLAKLKVLSRQCNLKKACTCRLEVDFSDEIVLNQLLAGLYDDEVRLELLKKDDLTLEQA